jgi:signal transduction histidine kinase
MLGYSKEEFIGKKLKDIGVFLGIDDIKQMILALNKRGIIYDEDIPIKTKAGQTIYSDIYLVDRARLVQCNIRDTTERKLAEDASINYQSQLRALAGHLQSIREDERANIAREIHDGLGQAMTGLKIELTNLKDIIPKSSDKKKNDTIHKMTDEMNEQINSLIESVKRISSELRPGVLDDLGLIAALEWQLQDFGNRTGINTVYRSTIDSISLNEKASTALFRIFQESLTNITRHAKATKVELRVRKVQNQLILEIEDNGRGITEAEILDKSSLGIMGMKERSILIGGEITFSGKPGEGTVVSIITPVQRGGSDI